jgi:hypothetical protein
VLVAENTPAKRASRRAVNVIEILEGERINNFVASIEEKKDDGEIKIKFQGRNLVFNCVGNNAAATQIGYPSKIIAQVEEGNNNFRLTKSFDGTDGLTCVANSGDLDAMAIGHMKFVLQKY